MSGLTSVSPGSSGGGGSSAWTAQQVAALIAAVVAIGAAVGMLKTAVDAIEAAEVSIAGIDASGTTALDWYGVKRTANTYVCYLGHQGAGVPSVVTESQGGSLQVPPFPSGNGEYFLWRAYSNLLNRYRLRWAANRPDTTGGYRAWDATYVEGINVPVGDTLRLLYELPCVIL